MSLSGTPSGIELLVKRSGGSLQPTSVTKHAIPELIFVGLLSVSFNVHPAFSVPVVLLVSMLNVLIVGDWSHERSIVHVWIDNHSVDSHEQSNSKKPYNKQKHLSGLMTNL